MIAKGPLSNYVAHVAALVSFLCVSGCTSESSIGPTTEIVFSAEADLDVPAGTMLQVTFWADGVRQHREGQVLDPVLFEDESRLRVATDLDALERRYTVFAELVHEGQRISWLRVRGGFLGADNGEIRVRFARACPEPADRPAEGFDSADTCGSHDSCVAAGCSSACYVPGLPDSEELSEPVSCPEEDCLSVDTLSVGRNMNCALSSGEGFCWGRVADMFESWNNQHRRPARVVDTSGIANFASNVESIEIDSEHVCLIADGALRCGGRNNGDSLVIGPPQPDIRPCCERALGQDTRFAELSLGPSATCAIDDLGVVMCFGEDPYSLEATLGPAVAFEGRTGHDRLLTLWGNLCAFRSGFFECTRASFPFFGPDIEVVSAEVSTVCLIRSSGQLECYGRDVLREQFDDVPHIVPGSWAHVSAATQYIGDDSAICAINADGEMFCWGDAEGGRIGAADFAPEEAAVQVGADETWASVGVGQRHSCALSAEGRVFCWGENSLGQLGRDGSSTLQPQSVCIPAY